VLRAAGVHPGRGAPADQGDRERGLILADVGIALGAFFTVALACYFLAIVLVGASASG